MSPRILISASFCLFLLGCSSASSNTETVPTPSAAPETTELPEETVTEVTPEPTPEPKSFLEENGLVITPQGNFEYTAWAEKGTFPMHASCTVEEGPSDTEGYKSVTATVTYDVTDSPGGMILTREFPFDRYTGICFDTTNELSDVLASGGSQQIESGAVFTYQDHEYTVGYTVEMINNWPQLIVNLTVICPEEYDGTVFVVRYSDEESNIQDTAVDWTQIHTIDELPYYTAPDTFYFTASDH